MSNSARIAQLESSLAKTRDAIDRIVTGGQAYSGEGRMMTRADLKTLRELEKDQARELSQLKRGARGRVFGVIHR